jgi:hypothetical protein
MLGRGLLLQGEQIGGGEQGRQLLRPHRLAAEQGRFRHDLYYRLNGLTVLLPALRERSDFVALTERMLQALAPDMGLSIAPEVMAAMARVQDHRIKSGGREAGCEGEQTEENPTAGECRE